MTTTTEKASAVEWFSLNWPSLIAIVVVFLIVSGLYVEGQHIGSKTLITLTSLIFPFSVIASTVFIVYVHTLRLTRQERGWYGSIAFFIALLTALIIGFGLGEASDAYVYLNRVGVATPWFATMSACGFAVILLFARSLRPKNTPFTFMLILSFLFVLALTPIGEMIFPASSDIGKWIQTNISQTGNDVIWFLIYLADIGLFIRVLTFKEKLRVGA